MGEKKNNTRFAYGVSKNITDVFEEGDVIYVKKIKKTDLWSLEQIPRVNGAVVVMNPGAVEC